MTRHVILFGDPGDEQQAPSVERFRCPDCGAGVKADEDGCCAHCGADCEIVELPAPTIRSLEPVEGRTEMEWKIALWIAIDKWARAQYEPGRKSVILAEKAVVEVHELIEARLANLQKPEGA